MTIKSYLVAREDGKLIEFDECRCGERFCKYYRGLHPINTNIHYCKAFMEGIPEDIAFGTDDHLVPRISQGNDLCYKRGTDKNLVPPMNEISIRTRRVNGHDCLCSTLRDIFLKTDDPEIKLWTRICITMAKNMFLCLAEYKGMLQECGVNIPRDEKRDVWQQRPFGPLNRRKLKNA